MSAGVSRCRAVGVLGGAVAGVVTVAAHRPGHLVVAAPGDPTGAVVVAAAWAAWVLAVYLLLGIAATALAALPRRRPAALVAAVRAVTPRLVRRLTEAAVGATAAAVLVATPTAALADAAAPSPPAAAAAQVPGLDWPGLVPTAAPRPPVALVSAAPRRPAPAGDGEVVVRAGDTLWSLSARRLGAGATDAQIAAAWPRLYLANRAVVGADPDLIRPGERLRTAPVDPKGRR